MKCPRKRVNSIVSWWPGDGHARDIQDGNHGTLRNGATFAAGMVGQAFSLDGIDDRIDIPDSPSLNPTAITIDAWAYLTGNPGIGMHLVSKDNDRAGRQYILVAISPYFYSNVWSAGGHIQGVEGEMPVDLFTWYHVAMTYDANAGFKIYVNGELEGSDPADGPIITTTEPLQLGTADPNGSYDYKGLLDEVDIYNRALTAAEILSIYNAGSAGKCKPPMVVASIDPFYQPNGRLYRVGTGITIEDTTTSPVAGARVTFDTTLPDETVITTRGTTDSNGILEKSGITVTEGVYTFTVTDVSKAGQLYDPSQNEETSDSEVVPTVIHVASIDPRYEPIGERFRVSSGITIQDEMEAPAAGATVRVGVTTPGGSRFAMKGTTDDTGTATVSFLTTTTGTYTFTVLKVTRAPWTYDASQNEETSDSVTIP